MDKLAMETKDITNENIEKILELFPNVATEGVNEDGKLVRAIDFEKLKQELSHNVIDGEESYDFTWVGKKEAMLEANRPIRKTLRPDKESSLHWDTTENIYIEGDNLDALKLLQESYLGKVKMIYIDPPYNTGKDFVYRDNFTQDKESYEDELGIKDEEGNKLFQNTESNGRFHSDWCSMIYPRLKLSRNLLSDDGVIFISIDDNEVRNLKNICDEVFGLENFVCQMVWQSKSGGAHDERYIVKETEYIIIYAKNKDELNLAKKIIKDEKYNLEDEYVSQRGKYILNKLDRRMTSNHYTESLNYPLVMPDNSILWPGGGNSRSEQGWNWRWGKDKLEWGIKNGFIVFKNNKGSWSVYSKQYEYVDNNNNFIVRTLPYRNLILSNEYSNTQASSEIIELFSYKIFEYAKSTKFINYLMTIANLKDNDIFMDFFSGSASSAHASMQKTLNDNIKIHYIMIQLPEKTENINYKNICEIGKERIRKAGEKIQKENPDKKLDIGFRVFKVDDTNMKDVYYSPHEFKQDQLGLFESNIKDDRSDEDLLYEVLINSGVELSLPHKVETIDGMRVHFIQSEYSSTPDLIACFEDKVPETLVRTIAQYKPTKVVFRDSCFRGDSNKINIEEIFKLITPDTRVKVL